MRDVAKPTVDGTPPRSFKKSKNLLDQDRFCNELRSLCTISESLRIRAAKSGLIFGEELLAASKKLASSSVGVRLFLTIIIS